MEAKKALLERELQTILIKNPQRIVVKATEAPNHGPKYKINKQPDKVYNIDSDFSHCRPSFFEFRDKKYAVNNWYLRLRTVLVLFTRAVRSNLNNAVKL